MSILVAPPTGYSSTKVVPLAFLSIRHRHAISRVYFPKFVARHPSSSRNTDIHVLDVADFSRRKTDLERIKRKINSTTFFIPYFVLFNLSCFRIYLESGNKNRIFPLIKFNYYHILVIFLREFNIIIFNLILLLNVAFY